MKRLPSELEDRVIDFCHADSATLVACGLVCRDWLPASRFHKFSSVSLNMENIAAFLEITVASEAITHLVREVELCYCGPFPPEFASLLMLMNRTVRLSLHPLQDEVVCVASTSSLSLALTALRLVHLKFDFRSRFESLGQIIDCVCLCPQLESLEVCGSWMQGVNFEVPPNLPKSLHTLTLTCDPTNFLTWLLTLEKNQLPMIRNLNLRHIVPREIPSIVRYLETLGPTLESLTLAFQNYGALAGPLNLAQNPNLREITLEGRVPGVLDSFTLLIPQLYLCKTERAAVCIRLGNFPEADQDIDAYDWEALDAVLSDSQRCRLRHLELAVVDRVSLVPFPGVLAYVLRRLPLARARGIVSSHEIWTRKRG